MERVCGPAGKMGTSIILAQEGLLLVPFMEVPVEVEENGATLAQEDGATVEDDAMAE